MSLGSQILQYMITGITLGGIYAIIAIGFTVIYNATGIINFAQGEFVMLGGLFMYSLQKARVPLALAFALSVLGVSAVGCALERLAIRPVRGASVLTLIIITIGASILIKGGAMLGWGKDAVPLKAFSGEKPFIIMDAVLLPQSVWVIGVVVFIVMGLAFFFEHTILGKAMRACAIDRWAAGLVGISVETMTLYSFALSAALGATAGIVISPMTMAKYDMGTMLGLKGFCAAVLGGLGSGVGAVISGFVIGLLEALSAGLLPGNLARYKDAVAFLVLLATLFVRQGGMLGRREEMEVLEAE